MLASLSGSLALLLGLAVMLLPLLGPELSRPRDSAWGALVLLLGLTLVTSADRLSGAPMLAVLCGGLLIGRLGGEVMQLRWRQLTPEEQQGLRSLARWQRSLSEVGVSLGSLLGRFTTISAALGSSLAGVGAALQRGGGRPRTAGSSKRWVRPEPAAQQDVEEPVTVGSFAEIDALISAADQTADQAVEQTGNQAADQTAGSPPQDAAEQPVPHSEAG